MIDGWQNLQHRSYALTLLSCFTSWKHQAIFHLRFTSKVFSASCVPNRASYRACRSVQPKCSDKKKGDQQRYGVCFVLVWMYIIQKIYIGGKYPVDTNWAIHSNIKAEGQHYKHADACRHLYVWLWFCSKQICINLKYTAASSLYR